MMLEYLVSAEFWVGLIKIIGVNIILSGDNAVVIALAARSLPPKQQTQAIIWGSGAGIVMRIILTLFAVALLTLPWLKIIGSLLLFWIGVKLLVPEEDDAEIEASDQLLSAIKTILIADLVMSLDNVIAVAAAAGGSVLLLILGLAISIPLVIFGATMLVTDPALAGLLSGFGAEFVNGKPMIASLNLELLAGGLGVVIVVALGKWLAKRHEAASATESSEKAETRNS